MKGFCNSFAHVSLTSLEESQQFKMQDSNKNLSKNGCFLSPLIREEHTDVLENRPDLELKLVQIFFRHGARTPIRLTPGVEEVTWDKDTMFVEDDHLRCDYEVCSLDGKSGPHHSVIEQSYKQTTFKGGSHCGQLTTLGMRQSYELGTYFKRHYMEKLKFLSPEFNSDDIYMRSTNINRNLKSLSCVLAAMYGEDLKTSQNGLPRFHVDHASTEILYPNYVNCRPIMNRYYKTIKNTDVIPGVRPVRLQVQELLDQDKDNEHLDLIMVRDGMSARKAHGFPVSPILMPLAGVVEKAAVDIIKYCIGCGSESTEVLVYTIGPLLWLILDNIEKVLRRESERKIHLHACHDTTLIPLLTALGIHDDTWPGLCSDFIIEMYQDSNGQCFIRNLYLGKEQKVGPNDNSLIPLDQFKEVVAPLLISTEEFRKHLVKVETF